MLGRYAADVTEQLLTVQDVAFRLRITPETVRRWLRTGKLRGALLGGDKMGYRIAESEVARLLLSANVGSSPDA
jgi:excisionase family DNA binding protein